MCVLDALRLCANVIKRLLPEHRYISGVMRLVQDSSYIRWAWCVSLQYQFCWRDIKQRYTVAYYPATNVNAVMIYWLVTLWFYTCTCRHDSAHWLAAAVGIKVIQRLTPVCNRFLHTCTLNHWNHSFIYTYIRTGMQNRYLYTMQTTEMNNLIYSQQYIYLASQNRIEYNIVYHRNTVYTYYC